MISPALDYNIRLDGSCEVTRLKLAVGYMLIFFLSKIWENDIAMNPQGGWIDYGGGFFWSE